MQQTIAIFVNYLIMTKKHSLCLLEYKDFGGSVQHHLKIGMSSGMTVQRVIVFTVRENQNEEHVGGKRETIARYK